MIEGLKYEFSSAQLIECMQERANYHTRRAAEKEAALPKMKSALAEIRSHQPDSTSPARSTNFTGYQLEKPDEDLERDIQEHRNKAKTFLALSAHVIPNEIYRLSEADLHRLEVLQP